MQVHGNDISSTTDTQSADGWNGTWQPHGALTPCPYGLPTDRGYNNVCVFTNHQRYAEWINTARRDMSTASRDGAIAHIVCSAVLVSATNEQCRFMAMIFRQRQTRSQRMDGSTKIVNRCGMRIIGESIPQSRNSHPAIRLHFPKVKMF